MAMITAAVKADTQGEVFNPPNRLRAEEPSLRTNANNLKEWGQFFKHHNYHNLISLFPSFGLTQFVVVIFGTCASENFHGHISLAGSILCPH